MKSFNPRTGEAIESGLNSTTNEQLTKICEKSAKASSSFRDTSRHLRAELLETIGQALEAGRDKLVAIADEETALGESRLNSELTRTIVQLQSFSDLLRNGSYLEVVIDEASETRLGPRPDLRRMLVPLGPVAVFCASNFPFAFSVCGGDTVSALAAGCPVIIKAHSSHIRTAAATFTALKQAVIESGFDPDVVALVFGHEAGRQLTLDPNIKAAGFTGSESGGRALYNLAASRPEPIPFYAEMGSINPAVVTPAAAATRGEQILESYIDSITLGGGQFCTKPGILFIPASCATALRPAVTARIKAAVSPWLLNAGIQRAYEESLASLEAQVGVEVAARSESETGGGYAVSPTLFWASLDSLKNGYENIFQECFGPAAVVVEYNSIDDLVELLGKMPGSLSASLLAEESETDIVPPLVSALTHRVGRIVWNAFTTGVAVSDAMTHGGPYPSSSSSLHTSVGTASIHRFLRPVTFQSFPQEFLDPEVRNGSVASAARRGNNLSAATG